MHLTRQMLEYPKCGKVPDVVQLRKEMFIDINLSIIWPNKLCLYLFSDQDNNYCLATCDTPAAIIEMYDTNTKFHRACDRNSLRCFLNYIAYNTNLYHYENIRIRDDYPKYLNHYEYYSILYSLAYNKIISFLFEYPSISPLGMIASVGEWTGDGMDCFSLLPREIFYHILNYCAPLDIFHLMFVNKQCYKTLSSKSIWKDFYDEWGLIHTESGNIIKYFFHRDLTTEYSFTIMDRNEACSLDNRRMYLGGIYWLFKVEDSKIFIRRIDSNILYKHPIITIMVACISEKLTTHESINYYEDSEDVMILKYHHDMITKCVITIPLDQSLIALMYNLKLRR